MPRPLNHLLLRAPNWLGDVIMAQPAMRAIALGLTPERLSLAGRSWLADLLPFLNMPSATYQPPDAAADVAVLFPNSFRAAWEARRAGTPSCVGFAGQWRRLLLTNAYAPRIRLDCEHHRDYFLDLAEQMGVDVSQRQVRLSVPDGEKQAGEKRISEYGLDPEKTVCLAPGSQFGGAKRYPVAGFAQLISWLAERGWQVLILGTPQEQDIGEQCLRGVKNAHYNAAGKTSLRQALQILCASRLLASNDSGLMHVAAGMSLPVVAIFGATDPARTSPSGEHIRLLYQPADCSPCLQRECSVAGQPCMANITPESILDACTALLD
ncbi:MAG: lipopolysaccharide heptosyltransferase II [Mariprofundaceae bacterium]